MNITIELNDLQNPLQVVLLSHIQHFSESPYLGAPWGMAPQKGGCEGKKVGTLPDLCFLDVKGLKSGAN